MKCSDDQSCNVNDTDNRYSALTLFLKQGGAEFPLLAIRPYNSKQNSDVYAETGTHRGVFIIGRKGESVDSEAIPVANAGSVILRIPLELLITVSIARHESEVGRVMYIQEKRILEADGDDGKIEDDWSKAKDLENNDEICKKKGEDKTTEIEIESVVDNSELSGDELDDDEICDILGLDMSAPMHCYLAAFILEDRLNPSSRFLPYYNSLPLVLPHIPLFWSDDDLHYLSGSFVYRQVLNRKSAIEHDYKETCRIHPPFSDVATLNDYYWARMIITSRNFGLDITTSTNNVEPDKNSMNTDDTNMDKINTDMINTSKLAINSDSKFLPQPPISSLPPHPSLTLSPPSSISLPPLSISPSPPPVTPVISMTTLVHSVVSMDAPVTTLSTLPLSVMPVTTLVPFGDMLNHYRPRQVRT